MNVIFYQDWYKKRLQKIINIFGSDWFAGKKILELGACYGNIGLELIKLGAHVTFTDCRQEHLDIINDKLKIYNVSFPTILLNQEEEWDLKQKFDLVLHLGVLYHIKNWKKDLESVFKHTNLCILESTVLTSKIPDSYKKAPLTGSDSNYYGKNGTMSLFCEESVEKTLSNLDCRYIRFDNKELNTDVSWGSEGLIQNVYDWNTNNKSNILYKNGNQISIQNRRFWLVMK